MLTHYQHQHWDNEVNLIYSSVRLIEQDDESFHTVHTESGIKHSSDAFRRLIDLAISLGGCYYLTYHKFATREQVLACYLRFSDFLKKKLKYDPNETFQSDWYRHYKKEFAS